MVATHMTATQPTTFPYLPRLNGPATKVLRDSVTLRKIGIAYAMYSPMVAIDTIAWNATILPSDCQFISHHITSHIQTQRRGRERGGLTVRAIQNDMEAESQTALTGTSLLFTLCHNGENGIAPSLENAYAILIISHIHMIKIHQVSKPNTKTYIPRIAGDRAHATEKHSNSNNA